MGTEPSLSRSRRVELSGAFLRPICARTALRPASRSLRRNHSHEPGSAIDVRMVKFDAEVWRSAKKKSSGYT